MATRQSPRTKRKPEDDESKAGEASKMDTDDESDSGEPNSALNLAEVANCDVYALNGTSCRLFQSIIKRMKAEDFEQNLVISPLAVFKNMYLAYDACKGQSKEELENSFFGFGQQLDARSGVAGHSQIDGLHANVQQINNFIQNGSSGGAGGKCSPYQLITTSKLAVSSTLEIARPKEDYLPIDLSDKEKARENINHQLATRTDNRITNLIKADNIPGKNNSALMVSAVHWRADWERKFLDKSKTMYETPMKNFLDGLPMSLEDFHNVDGSVKKVLMVHLEEKIFLTRDEDLKVTMLELPFSSHLTNLIIVMPDDTDSVGLRTFEESFTHQTFELLQKNAQMPLTRVYFPKFAVESHLSLIKALNDVGVKHMFDAGSLFSSNTDWNEFTSGGDALTHVSDVLHGASFCVSVQVGSEQGKKRRKTKEDSKDAAVCIQMEAARFANGFHVNRPFFFLVQSTWPAIWCMMGHVQHLDEADSAVWRHLEVPT